VQPRISKRESLGKEAIKTKKYLQSVFHIRGKVDRHSRKFRIPKICSITKRHFGGSPRKMHCTTLYRQLLNHGLASSLLH
jgi:hypothetical protein